jgi:hypothetical protein
MPAAESIDLRALHDRSEPSRPRRNGLVDATMPRTLTRAACLALLPLASCAGLGISGQVGYMQSHLGGEIALSPNSGGLGLGTITQDIDDLGLSDDSDSLYARVQADLGVMSLSVSGFNLRDEGTAALDVQFGGITAGTTVNSKVEFGNVKSTLTFPINLGPVQFAPGVAVDVFDLDVDVRDTNSNANEQIDVLVPAPLAFGRAVVDLGGVALVGEAGYMNLNVDDVDGEFLDLEGWLEVRATSSLFLFAGYRWISIKGDGVVDNQDFSADLTISGWQLGGGIRF